MQHVPRTFLCYADGPGQFATADSILGIHDAPDGDKPLIETKRRIFKDRSYLYAELFAAVFRLTLIHAPGSDTSNTITATIWASNFSIRPLHFLRELVTDIQVREVPDRFH